MFFYPLPPFFPFNLSISTLIFFFFFRVISDKKALSVIACYLGQGLELNAFVYGAIIFLFRLIFIFPMFEIY